MKRLLDRDIQMGGAEGHDSGEDARAAGELVRLKVRLCWKDMKSKGWTVKGDAFVAPEKAATVDERKMGGDGGTGNREVW